MIFYLGGLLQAYKGTSTRLKCETSALTGDQLDSVRKVIDMIIVAVVAN